MLNTKEDALKNVGNQTVDGSHCVSMEKQYGSQWLPATALLPTFFKASSSVFNTRKKLIQVLRVTE